MLAGLGVPTLALSGPWCYKKLPRIIRDLLRLLMGTIISLCVYLMVFRELLASVVIIFVLTIFWRFYLKARIKRRLHACDGCEELSDNTVCSGCQLQADGMRKYEQKATQLYLESGQVPDIPITIRKG